MVRQTSDSTFAGLHSETQTEQRARYKPFLLDDQMTPTDWVSKLELDTATDMARRDLLMTGKPLRILVLYGSLRKRYEQNFHPVSAVTTQRSFP